MRYLILLLLLIPFAYAYYIFPDLPEQIPTHFGIEGKPDAWGPKSSIYVAPTILSAVGCAIFILFQNLIRFDPKIEKSSPNAKIFQEISIGLVVFMGILSFFIVYASANPGIKIEKFLFPLIGLAFSMFGRYMPKIGPNYFAGFRLPWTLESPENWKMTHLLAGKLWFYGGMAQAIMCYFLTGIGPIIVFLGITAIIVIIPIAYSYKIYKSKNI
ncbi:DUF1648 domain-containing protein [Sandaracinomonas limnophila]|uniref:DUF1648 domain-containing protein n=1 Tax=Sandaracinomonas limnophila TaxID=1862386 RepID=A0A437PUT3_9BACT|nr:SdpI family protein [Sandaracinomonas limnophila]RVU25978.1 DUF1648 domain-containing protein [Sandaracinomonas limnophila]